MNAWAFAARDYLARGEPAVLVSVVSVRGSAPRDAGTVMLVGRNETFGTIGGGQLEYRASELAARALGHAPREATERRFPLGADCGQCCGGVVQLRFEDLRLARDPVTAFDAALEPADFDLAVFGAGHVGSACVAVLSMLDCRIRWIDARPDIFPAALPGNVAAVRGREPPAVVADLPAQSHLLVMTHSHPLDFDICAAALARDDFAFIGLIGSVSKRRRFEKRFRQLGVGGVERLTCPIGIGGISGKTPAEIAVAVSAQLLELRESATARRSPAVSVM
ncbi:MAG: xanthine dehydrogenase accessory protein XdhC [Woeseiaceae bacterium]|nr:xanthine dehydrogenase accessory protein XdhC [Woeseiaceae bacterium]